MTNQQLERLNRQKTTDAVQLAVAIARKLAIQDGSLLSKIDQSKFSSIDDLLNVLNLIDTIITTQQRLASHGNTTQGNNMSILTVEDRQKMIELMQRVITEDGELIDDREIIRSACAQTLFILTDGEEGDECED